MGNRFQEAYFFIRDNISVDFKFADEFRRIAEYMEVNTTAPPRRAVPSQA